MREAARDWPAWVNHLHLLWTVEREILVRWNEWENDDDEAPIEEEQQPRKRARDDDEAVAGVATKRGK